MDDDEIPVTRGELRRIAERLRKARFGYDECETDPEMAFDGALREAAQAIEDELRPLPPSLIPPAQNG